MTGRGGVGLGKNEVDGQLVDRKKSELENKLNVMEEDVDVDKLGKAVSQ